MQLGLFSPFWNPPSLPSPEENATTALQFGIPPLGKGTAPGTACPGRAHLQAQLRAASKGTCPQGKVALPSYGV